MKLKIQDAEFEGEPSEIIAVLSSMGYGPNPGRPLFAIKPEFRRPEAPAQHDLSALPSFTLPSRDEIAAFLLNHPRVKTGDAVRTLGGSFIHDRETGETNRVLYTRLFTRVSKVQRGLERSPSRAKSMSELAEEVG